MITRRKSRKPLLPIHCASLTEDELDRVVECLNEHTRKTGLELTLKIGQEVIGRFFSGSLHSWRERGPKDPSLRRLAAHPRLMMSPTALFRCIGIYELCMRLGISTWKHLTTSHLRIVLGLPEASQRALLEQADKERWTVNDLHHQASLSRRLEAESRGRPTLPRFVKTLHQLHRIVEGSEDAFGELERLDDLTPEQAMRLYQTAALLRAHCEEFQLKFRERFLIG